MFGKKKVVIDFIDVDKDNALIASSGELTGKRGKIIDYDPASKINSLIDDGYVLVKNGFNENGQTPHFTSQENVKYQISFRHDHQIIDADHPGFGYDKTELQKTITQTVHYDGAAMRTPADSKTSVKFNHALEFDKVTGKQIADKGWTPKKQNFMMIGTPTLPGFIPDKAVVGGDSVAPHDKDRKYTVTFNVNRQPSTDDQNAIINYVDLASDNDLITSDHLSGKPNMPIDYDPDAKIKELVNAGYLLINNGFNPNNEVEFFSNSDDYTPTFVITMKHTDVLVNAAHPNDNVDPYAYKRTVKFLVNFSGAGDATPAPIEQTANWTRTITAVPATGQIIQDGKFNTNWKLDKSAFKDVRVPVVPGYHTDVKIEKAHKIGLEDDVRTVTYQANGHMIPIDEDDRLIKGAEETQFETDPNDPTKVLAEEIVPDIKGYNHQQMTLTPLDPGKDVKIRYKSKDNKDVLVVHVGDKNYTQEERIKEEKKAKKQAAKLRQNVRSDEKENADAEQEKRARQAREAEQRQEAQMQATQATNTTNPMPNMNTMPTQEPVAYQIAQPKDQVAIVNFIDVDHNGMQLTSSGPLTGKPGDSINDLYSTEIPLRAIRNAGYEVVFNSFDSDGFVQRFDNNDLMVQIFTIGVRKKRDHEQNNHDHNDDD